MARVQPGNTLRTARATVLGTNPRTLRGALSVRDGNDFWKFTLAVRSSFSLNLAGIAKTANADALLLNNRGGLIRALRSPRNRPERLANLALDPGTYYVRVQRRTGTTRYALSLGASPLSPGGTPTPTPGVTPTPTPGVTPTPTPGVTPTPTPGVTPTPTPGVTPTPTPADAGGNSLDTASPLVPTLIPAIDFNPRSLTDFVGDVDPQDFFSFSPTTAGNLSLQLTGLSADANIELYSGNSLIASGDANDSLLQNIAQSGGSYSIRVLQGATGNNTNYTLNLTLTPIDTVGDTAATATLINDLVITTPPADRQPTAVRSEFVSGSDLDFYRFDLTAQSFVGIDLLNQGGNADLELYEDGVLQSLLSSARGVGAPEQIGGTLSAGTYYLRVAAGTGATGSPYSFTMYAESTAGLPTITRDIAFGETGSLDPENNELVNVNGTLYFAATEPGVGTGLWRSTGGTTGGSLDQTTKVRDFNTLSNFVAAGSTLYFVADDGQSGEQLWTYDGNTATPLTSSPGNEVKNLTAVGDSVYFTLANIVTGLANERLWRSDGTATGTSEVGDLADLATPIAEAGKSPGNLVAVGNDLYYVAVDPTDILAPTFKGREVWKIAGAGTATPARAAITSDLEPGSFSSNPTNLTAIGPNLFFAANTVDDGFGLELRRLDSSGTLTTFDVSDGTSSALTPDATLPQVWNIVEMGGNVYFAADAGVGTGEELWRVPTNGSATSATLVTDLINQGAGSSSPRNLTVLNNKVFFLANDGTNGTELYVYDGTTTTLLTPGRPVNAPDIQGLVTSGTNLYFTMGTTLTSNDITTATGRELWKSDGTIAGTNIVFDISPGGVLTPGTPGDPNATPNPILPTPDSFEANESNPINLTDANGRLFFAANNGQNGVELWTLT